MQQIDATVYAIVHQFFTLDGNTSVIKARWIQTLFLCMRRKYKCTVHTKSNVDHHVMHENLCLTLRCHIVRLEDCSNQKKSHRSDHGISIRLGPILKYMDICACLSAERLAKTSCVTLSMDHLVFDDTIQVSDGEAMIIEAKVVRSFNSSAEVLAEVFIDGLGPVDGTCFAHAYFIFVRVDKGKMPVTFPQNSREIQEFLMSMERRKARQTKNVMMSAAQVQFDDNFSAITTPHAEPTDQAFRTPADCSLLKFTHVVLPPHANHMVLYG